MGKLKSISQVLFFILLVIAFLLITRSFFVPFLYGLLIALVLYPVCKGLEKRRFSRGLAIFTSLTLTLIFFLGIVAILLLQVNAINRELPQIIGEINTILVQARDWIAFNLGITLSEQKDIFLDAGNSLTGYIRGLVSDAATGIINLILIPVYSGLILYYRNVILDFIISIVGQKHREELPGIITEAIHTYFNYIKGMLLVYLTVGILNSIGLFLLGVKHPLLFGMLTAFMTIIPYFGIIISSLLPIGISWAETKSIYIPLGIVGVFSLIQYLEAYFIFPYIVGKQLKINTFASIVLIIIGGLIWGISGMLLFLPYMALLKIVSGKIEELKPLRILLEIPAEKKK